MCYRFPSCYYFNEIFLILYVPTDLMCVLQVGAGRNNLLHCLLLFVAVCAAREPPALQRLHLGRAGLNLLWVVGR